MGGESGVGKGGWCPGFVDLWVRWDRWRNGGISCLLYRNRNVDRVGRLRLNKVLLDAKGL